ncbi:hypothetical protein LINPERPRIM_LOCUS21363, partial [Linum perenne]
MARRTAKQRRRVIVYVVAMCYHVMQQVVGLLTECSGSSRSITEEGEYIPRPLPYGPDVYRTGFLHHTTRTTNVNCINMLRMSKKIFWNLCELLESA